MALYQSEFTQFINRELDKNPQWREEQISGRALLWDRAIDQSEQQKWEQSQLVQQAYPYDNHYNNFVTPKK